MNTKLNQGKNVGKIAIFKVKVEYVSDYMKGFLSAINSSKIFRV